MSLLRDRAEELFLQLQETICAGLAREDGVAAFAETVWQHQQHGGGRTRVLGEGSLFEKAGVNFSAVKTLLTDRLAERMKVGAQEVSATGLSLVLHPASPMVPTVHMNLRYVETADGDAWFGGGLDLTPYYLFEEDARHFHGVLKHVCDRHDPSWYPRFKQWCDEYFFLPHRDETRGIGGIFFDYLRGAPEKHFAFVKETGENFLEAYLPVVSRRRFEPFGEREKAWQLIRRGRYVEFNLIYDRGTLFGLETKGRTESILMSLPPMVRWAYDHRVEPGSREEALVRILHHPQSWT
jgi:coproporphyrinogen III oxidase